VSTSDSRTHCGIDGDPIAFEAVRCDIREAAGVFELATGEEVSIGGDGRGVKR
jgi:hypothetical protein